MFEKIDKNLLSKIVLQNCNNSIINCIILSNKYESTKKELYKIFKSQIVELPIISGFAINCDCGNLYRIASLNCVKFITNDARVNSLMKRTNEFLHTPILKEKVDSNDNHSVVIIDTGIYPHLDFCLGKNRVVKFVDLINNKEEMYDDNGHGTFVSGVLAGSGIVENFQGIDNNANVIVIKALDSDGETTSIKILQAMQWILDNKDIYNIKVVCMSFGSVLSERNDPLMFGAEVLWNNGIVVVCAGGNSGPNSSTIMSPGASKKVITVGSLDNLGGELDVADFSSRGPVFNYYKPDLVVPGVDIISTNVFSENKKFYTKMTGTSVSTPIVAGVVSLMFYSNPKYTPDQIKYMLLSSCTHISGDRNSEGSGFLDLRKLKLI